MSVIHRILPIITFIIPALGMIAGLSAAATITLYLLVLMICLRLNIRFVFADKVIELLFITWCFISCLWSINLLSSVGLCLAVTAICVASFILVDNISLLNSKLDNIKQKSASCYKHTIVRYLVLGIITAIILFFIEKFSDGFLTRNFRILFQTNNKNYFALHMLDRGCALLSVLVWVAIGALMQEKRYFYSLSLYCKILYLLIVSDSSASLLAFICAGLVFAGGWLFASRFYQFLRIAILAGVICAAFFAYHIAPQDLSDKYNIPISAKHRLFIWHFVTDKILEKPIFGWGMGSSKYIEVAESEIIHYENNNLAPLPLHPHNNVLQILLELGIVGFILVFLLINKWLAQIASYTNINGSYFAICGYACFTNYLIIGMISYSVWQLWWVSVGALVAFMMNWLVNK